MLVAAGVARDEEVAPATAFPGRLPEVEARARVERYAAISGVGAVPDPRNRGATAVAPDAVFTFPLGSILTRSEAVPEIARWRASAG